MCETDILRKWRRGSHTSLLVQVFPGKPRVIFLTIFRIVSLNIAQCGCLVVLEVLRKVKSARNAFASTVYNRTVPLLFL